MLYVAGNLEKPDSRTAPQAVQGPPTGASCLELPVCLRLPAPFPTSLQPCVTFQSHLSQHAQWGLRGLAEGLWSQVFGSGSSEALVCCLRSWVEVWGRPRLQVRRPVWASAGMRGEWELAASSCLHIATARTGLLFIGEDLSS